jgi:hypothetical protein
MIMELGYDKRTETINAAGMPVLRDSYDGTV